MIVASSYVCDICGAGYSGVDTARAYTASAYGMVESADLCPGGELPGLCGPGQHHDRFRRARDRLLPLRRRHRQLRRHRVDDHGGAVMSCAHSAARSVARSAARPVNARWGGYPAALELLWSSERWAVALKGSKPSYTGTPTVTADGVVPGDGPTFTDAVTWANG